MKISCNVIEDILPIYYDGVCSDESATLIEEHLKECTKCSRVLSDLCSGIDIPKKSMDELKPLKGIQQKWKKSKQIYIRRGICIALATLLLIVTLLTGIWYFRYGKYYYNLTKAMDQTSEEDKFFTSSDYTTELNGYRFEVWLPTILSNSGFIRVTAEDGLIMFLYPEVGGDYSFWFYITNECNESYSVYLKSDMSADFENHPFPVHSEDEKSEITQLLEDKNKDIASMIDEVKALWGIDLI